MLELAIIKKYFENYCEKSNKVMFDIGAHVGSSSIPFAKKNWKIFCFEPDNTNFIDLQGTMKFYKNVTCYNIAISDKDENEVPFFISNKHFGIHSLASFHETHTKKIFIKTRRLDSFVESNHINSIDFLKIDTEGADFLVLQSLNWKLFHPFIVMAEFMDSRTIPFFNYSLVDTVDYMSNLNYFTYIFEYEPVFEFGQKGVKTKNPDLIEVYAYSSEKRPKWGNVLFVLKENKNDFEKVLKKFLFYRKIKTNIRNFFNMGQ
jgi:FkbM family methyltransferase